MILAIIQARQGNTRFPGKDTMYIKNKRVIEHIVDRVKQSKYVNKICIATTESTADYIYDQIFYGKITVIHGSTNDVLDRFNYACNAADATQIVRITGDCPCFDYKIMDRLIEKHLAEKNDITTTGNVDNVTYPDGMDVEVIERNALFKAWKEATSESDRQHVTMYIKNNPIKFKIGVMSSEINYSHIRLSIDYEVDYELVKKVYDELYDKNNYFGFDEVVELYKNKPELFDMNKSIVNNEGYYKDLNKEIII